MRDIRFRVWDKIMNRMVEDIAPTMLTEPSEVFVGMQFIGLKDRNNIDFCESDIIESVNKNLNGNGIRFIIVFYFNAFCIQTLDKKYIPRNPPQYFWKNYSVIGNIYENKELLK